jgi:hypothetical protein
MHTRDVFGYYSMRPHWNCADSMPTQNVFVFWFSPLFYESICRLLTHPNINLVGATSDYTAVSADIVRMKPNTILIEDTGMHHHEMVNEYLELIPWAIKIILLSFNDKKIVVYHHEQRTIVQTDDLRQLILSELR